MNVQTTLALGIFAVGLSSTTIAAIGAPAPKPAPNIVYILTDDLGYGDVGCNNPQSKIATPNIDSIARDGMRFTDAHSSSAVCTPTRYSLLTGRYNWRSSLKSGVLNGFSKPLIEPGRETVAALLQGQGYTTACIGKWHLGLGWQHKTGTNQTATTEAPAGGESAGSAGNIDFTQPLTAGPNTLGFDYSYILAASLDMPPYAYIENGKIADQPLVTIPGSGRPTFYRGGLASPSFKHQTTLLTFTQKAQTYLDARGKEPEKPFFLYLALPAPHTPHIPRPEFVGHSHAGNYGDFVEEVDWSVGQVLDALKRNGFDKNTLVVFTSDNGSNSVPLHLDTLYGHLSNGNLRGQKSDAWDGGHRVPFLVRWPGSVKAGSVNTQTIGLTDFMATCAALTGTALPANAGEDSVSILPLITGASNKPIHEAVIHHSIDGKFAIRDGKWKLILAKGSGGWSLKEADVPADAPAGQLYDLETDPTEQNNLYTQKPQVVAQLSAILKKYQDNGRSTPLPKPVG